jgi:hypothetical protein
MQAEPTDRLPRSAGPSNAARCSRQAAVAKAGRPFFDGAAGSIGSRLEEKIRGHPFTPLSPCEKAAMAYPDTRRFVRAGDRASS